MHFINTKHFIAEEIKFIDKFVYVASIFNPLSTLPQIYEIVKTQDVSGLSLFTWVAYVVFSFVFLLYAINRRLWPFVIANILWVIVQGAVVAGILMYG